MRTETDYERVLEFLTCAPLGPRLYDAHRKTIDTFLRHGLIREVGPFHFAKGVDAIVRPDKAS